MLENTDRKLLWLWLDVAFGPADKRLWDVMSYYDSVEEMCDDLLSLRCGYVTQQEAEKIPFHKVTPVGSWEARRKPSIPQELCQSHCTRRCFIRQGQNDQLLYNSEKIITKR